MFFDNWTGLLRVVVVGPLAYLALIAFLRVSGKRTLAKLNAFDLIVTVALGSTLASVIITESVALLEGLAALALLILLQYAIAWLSVRSDRFQSLIKSEPTLVYHRGRFLDGPMRRERLTREEVLAAIRGGGIASLDRVGAVVLETDGTISVLDELPQKGAGTLDTVTRPS
jgi:uncharacterized membrane protein YcaP (DUF421 family)